ncbi:MAG: iron-sulfur cluster assembly scaffold protein [Candidatus Omnitrophica bacterium]|nr:iron-sulfur cluster assembly scaffold protein [Candidatus Omnitrophota bacterium]
MGHEHYSQNNGTEYPREAAVLINNQKYFGRMNDPGSSAYVKGPCGDAMEFYLVIDNDKITEIRYYTDGCHPTRACAAMAAKLADGKTIKEALTISAGEIIAGLKGLPEDHLHCAILSISTLYRAIADYLLKK